MAAQVNLRRKVAELAIPRSVETGEAEYTDEATTACRSKQSCVLQSLSARWSHLQVSGSITHVPVLLFFCTASVSEENKGVVLRVAAGWIQTALFVALASDK